MPANTRSLDIALRSPTYEIAIAVTPFAVLQDGDGDDVNIVREQRTSG